MIRTLIIEDDYRVADIHATYVSNVEGFEVIGKAPTGKVAYEMILLHRPDLILLDLFLPDEQGLELYSRLQKMPEKFHMDVFVITAARDSQSVKEALQLGAANYIVKPFTQKQLSDRLVAYRAAFRSLNVSRDISQFEVDQLSALIRGLTPTGDLNNGARKPTVESIISFLNENAQAISAAELAKGLGISRATAQRYLSQMVDRGTVKLELQYGTAGRPIHKYRPGKRAYETKTRDAILDSTILPSE